jgi:hypothetical protein
MSTINYNYILSEILNELRSADILTISERGMTTKTDTFSAAGGSETFTLTETSAKNIRTVKQNDVDLVFGTDYLFGYTNGNITTVVVSKVLIEDDEIKITYDYGLGDKIYSDFARPDISISSFPRIGFNFVTMDTEIIAIDAVQSFNPRIQFSIWDYSKEGLLDKMTALRAFIKDNEQGLYYSNILRIVGGTSFDIVRDEGKSKIYKMDLDIINELNIERN